MKHYPKEKFPGVKGETFEIRIVDRGIAINVEINLEYLEGGKKKLAHFRTDTYTSGASIDEIREKTRANLRTISIINRVAQEAKIGDIIPMPKKKK